MPQPYLTQLSQELNLPMSTVESKWSQAKAAIHSQYPNLTEKDSKFWALVTSVTKKMLHVKESLMKPRTRLQEADLSGGTPDDTEDVVIFDDYQAWVAAVVSCGASVDSGSIFVDTASAYIGDTCVGEWNGDTGYVDCTVLDQLYVPSEDPQASQTQGADGNVVASTSDNDSDADQDSTTEGFEALMDSEMTFVNALINEAVPPDTQDANIDAQIAAADEKIENLRSHKLQLIAQKRTEEAKNVTTQINSIRQHLTTIRQQKKQLAAQRKIQKQNKGNK